MHRILGWLGRGLLALVVVVLLLPAVLPPFLDRIYHRGPVSAHFDGQRFFNPDEDRSPASQQHVSLGVALRMALRRQQDPWPAHVATPQAHPPAQVAAPRMLVTWVGHSTVLVQAGGINILTDPIWSDRAGPWGLLGPKRVRAPGIAFDDLPHIDLVLVSHDHYDHMDLATLKRLWRRDRPLIVTSLGNDTILRGVGVDAVARDWDGMVPVRPTRRLADGTTQDPITVTVERVHHWGSRWGQDRNRALWSGFAVSLPGGNLFFAGDTGWGDGSWPAVDAKDGPYRLALIPIGAYQPRAMMSPSHIGPLQAVAAFRMLHAAYGLGVHWGTFRLSAEGMVDPPRQLHAEMAAQGVPPGRFRALEVGQSWSVPALPEATSLRR